MISTTIKNVPLIFKTDTAIFSPNAIDAGTLAMLSMIDFTLILSNPPYHTDFSVAKNFIEGGYKRLVIGGRMVMVQK